MNPVIENNLIIFLIYGTKIALFFTAWLTVVILVTCANYLWMLKKHLDFHLKILACKQAEGIKGI